MSYQKTTGPLMANSHPGSYSGQDAYNDMLVTAERERERWTFRFQRSDSYMMDEIASTLAARMYKDATDIVVMLRED